MSDDEWATIFDVARCGGDASVYTAYSWLVTALAEIISHVRGALGVGVEVLTDSTFFVQPVNGNDGRPADFGCLSLPWDAYVAVYLLPTANTNQ
jgi:hypothetical protein